MAVLCWDFDGTLVLSHHLWSNSVRKALDETVPDNKIRFTDIRKCMATGFTWHTPFEDYSNMLGEDWWAFMENHICKSYISLGLTENQAKKASKKVRSILTDTQNFILYKTTVETLKATKNLGHKNIILSNNFPELEDVIEKLGIKSYFENFIISALEGYDKPRSEIFEKAKRLYPDEKYFMIGDSISADIIGGKNAGMTTILVHKGYNQNADYCVDRLSDILKIRGIVR